MSVRSGTFANVCSPTNRFVRKPTDSILSNPKHFEKRPLLDRITGKQIGNANFHFSRFQLRSDFAPSRLLLNQISVTHLIRRRRKSFDRSRAVGIGKRIIGNVLNGAFNDTPLSNSPAIM